MILDESIESGPHIVVRQLSCRYRHNSRKGPRLRQLEGTRSRDRTHSGSRADPRIAPPILAVESAMPYADFRRSTTTHAATTSAAATATATSQGATVLDSSAFGWSWAAVVDSDGGGAVLGSVVDEGVTDGVDRPGFGGDSKVWFSKQPGQLLDDHHARSTRRRKPDPTGRTRGSVAGVQRGSGGSRHTTPLSASTRTHLKRLWAAEALTPSTPAISAHVAPAVTAAATARSRVASASRKPTTASPS